MSEGRGELGWLLCLVLPGLSAGCVLYKGPWGLGVEIQLLGTDSELSCEHSAWPEHSTQLHHKWAHHTLNPESELLGGAGHCDIQPWELLPCPSLQSWAPPGSPCCAPPSLLVS